MKSSIVALDWVAYASVLALPMTTSAYPQANLNQTYLSRPDLGPPLFEFSIFNESFVEPGYIIMAPFTPDLTSNLAAGSSKGGSSSSSPEALALYDQMQIQNGPCIFDEKGTLIYSGYGSAGPVLAADVKVDEYQGKPAMTFYDGNDRQSGNRGHGVIMNEQYETVATVQTSNGRTSFDIHEFTVLPGGTALTTIFQPTQYDLTPYGVEQPVGWVIQGIFQEIDISNGSVVFQWNSLDHTIPKETYNSIGLPSAGDGITQGTGWDYFHLNSIEKTRDGNYLISSRYLSTLFLINGTDSSIIWRLNGKQSDFTFEGFNRTFAFQHHARIQDQNDTTTVISLFDNGSDGNPHPDLDNQYSSGMVISLDLNTKVCTLLKQYHSPDNILSSSQGSLQIRDNGNAFMGWGSQPYISEFTPDGNCVMQGQFGDNNGLAMNYRAFKINATQWHGMPDTTPAIWAYAKTKQSPTQYYVSWNGATEVDTWKFYSSTVISKTSPLTPIGTARKTGFETEWTADKFHPLVLVEALDKDGNSLGRSARRPAFVPSQNVSMEALGKQGNTTVKYPGS